MIERVLVFRFQSLRWTELKQLHAVQRPAVRSSDGVQLADRLRERDVNGLLASIASVQQELQCKRRLPGAGATFDQVHSVGCEAADQKFVETRDSGGDGRREHVC